jgi:hypothetical protein
MKKPIVVGVVGCGYWGPNLVQQKFDQLLRGDPVPAAIIQMVASTQVYAGPNCLAYWV